MSLFSVEYGWVVFFFWDGMFGVLYSDSDYEYYVSFHFGKGFGFGIVSLCLVDINVACYIVGIE